MKSSKPKFCCIAILLCVLGMTGPGVNLAFAQDEDPFAARNRAQHKDPFGNQANVATDDPFGRATKENPFGGEADEEDPFAGNKGQKLEQPDAKLQAKLNAYQHTLSQLKSENEALKQKIDSCESFEESLTESYQTVIARLLTSSDESLQMIALEELIQLEARIPMTDEVDKRLMELADLDDPVVGQLALGWLAKYEPTKAVKLGFQLAGPWRPISTSQRNTEVRRALSEPTFFDFEETELNEVADEVREILQLNVIIDSKVDTSTPVTFRISGLPLRTALHRLLAAHELALHVHEEHLAIVPTTRSEPKLTFVYNVKGLLNEEMSLDGIAAQLNSILTTQGLDGRVLPIDKHRFSITASDLVHHKVGEFLGQLR